MSTDYIWSRGNYILESTYHYVWPLIKNKYSQWEHQVLVGLFSGYNGPSIIADWSNDVTLINYGGCINVTGNTIALRYPQLMVTLLPLQKLVAFWGSLVIVTRE